jgi:hypothetical protein
MAGARIEASYPTLPRAQHPQGHYRLEEEHPSWGNVLKAVTDLQTELAQIEQAEYREEK